jgi:hypothetical protein
MGWCVLHGRLPVSKARLKLVCYSLIAEISDFSIESSGLKPNLRAFCRRIRCDAYSRSLRETVPGSLTAHGEQPGL